MRVVLIEGIGEYAGQWRFCDRVPSYATTAQAALYKPWLVRDSMPRSFPEDGNTLGGVSATGDIDFQITDGVGARAGGNYNALTRKLGTDAEPDFELAAAIAATGPSLAGVVIEGRTDKLAQVVELETVLFAGGEAWLVEAVTASTSTTKTITIGRAALATEAQGHDARAAVFLYVPYTAGRRVKVLLGWDVSTFSQANEREIGSGWRIDGDGMREGLGAYAFRAASSLSTINRHVYRKYYSGTVRQIAGAEEESAFTLEIPSDVDRLTIPAGANHFGGVVFMKHGNEEIVQAELYSPRSRVLWRLIRDRRGMVGTKRMPFEIGETVQQVFCAWGVDGKSSFAYQEPGAETTLRTTGDWIRDERCEHPVPITLGLLTSSAAPGNKDGLEVSNWVLGSGNFSALPPGAGAGIPIAEIDWASAHRLWMRTLDWRLPHFVLDRSATARDVLDKEILRLTGILVTVRAGKLYFDLPSVPVIGTTGISWGPTDLLTEPVATGVERSRLTDDAATELGAPVVEFTTRKPGGGEHSIIIDDADYPALTGHVRSKFGLDTASIKIPARAVPVDRGGAARLLEDVGIKHLVRHRRPPRRHELATNLAWIAEANVGDYALLTHPDLVDRRNRRRGVENLVLWLASIRPDLSTGEIIYKALSFAVAGRFGLVPPSAAVDSVAGAVATCDSNRYTDASAPLSLTLPTRDVEAFNVTDVCQVTNTAGVPLDGGSTQVLLSIDSGADELELDGDFGGALAAGTIVRWAPFDQCTDLQKLSYVFWAEHATTALGAADLIAAFNYGER